MSNKVVVVTAIIAMLWVGGCKKSSDFRDKVSDPDQFIWTARLYSESDERNVFWSSNVDDVARVEIKGDDYQGTVRIRVYDDAGSEVYDETFEEDEARSFRETDFTHPPTAGNWHVRIDLEDSSGYLRVIIDKA